MTLAELPFLLPIILTAATAVIVMLARAFFPYHTLINRLTLFGLVATMVAIGNLDVSTARQVTPLIIIDSYAFFYSGLVVAVGIVVTLLSEQYFKERYGEDFAAGEYYILLMVAILGGVVMVSSDHFASFFIGLELLGVSLYVLVAYLGQSQAGREPSLEAGIKYLILSGVSSALMLFGIALIYAQFGILEFSELGLAWNRMNALNDPFVAVGLALLLAGAGFKLSLVPFHMWTPDVYQGSPAPVTAFIATVSKAAMIAVLMRFFATSGVFAHDIVFYGLSLMVLLSMLGGNLLALLQTNIKRILAYSSIAHMGYMMVAFLAAHMVGIKTSDVAEAVSIYMVGYVISSLVAFGVVIVLSDKYGDRDRELIEDYRGLFWKHPLLASAMTAAMLSLAGMPLTVGFIGKFYVFIIGANGFLWVLLAALMIGSAIGLYYYLKIIITLFSRDEQTVEVNAPDGMQQSVDALADSVNVKSRLVLALLTLAMLGLGIFPQPLIDVIRGAGIG